MSKYKPKKKSYPDPERPALELRHALASDFEAAGRILDEDPSILDANAYGTESALHFWAVENRPDIVEWLLKRGADPNRVSEISSALLDAASLGGRDVCRLLVEAGGDVGYRDASDITPLHQASTSGHIEVIGLLIGAGADVNAKDICGETPWDQALPRKAEEVRALLEEHGGARGVDDDWDEE